jgi:hypothetical protein
MTQIKREVVATVLGHGFEDVDAQFDGLEGDRSLGDDALVVGGEHPAILARGTSRGTQRMSTMCGGSGPKA